LCISPTPPTTIKDAIGEDLVSELEDILLRVKKKINESSEDIFVNLNSIKLYNGLIECVTSEISKKTGSPLKPYSTGFKEYASKRIEIELGIKEIISNLEKTIPDTLIYVGNLGDKGNLYFKTQIKFQNGNVTESAFKSLSSVNKAPQKKFANDIYEIYQNLYTNQLFEKIANLNSTDDIESIKTLNELILLINFLF
jgi:hypothetical protein